MTSKEISQDTVKSEDNDALELQPQDFAVEIEVDASEVLYKCVQCSITCKSAAGLKRHKNACKAPQTVPETASDGILVESGEEDIIAAVPVKYTLSCDQCTKKFKFKASLVKHVKEAHSQLTRSVSCPCCPQRCPNKKKLAEHMKSHESKKVGCKRCGRTFTRTYHLVRHLKQKGCGGRAPVKSFQCKVCCSSFSRKDNLLSHLRSHISLDPNRSKCKICEKIVPSFSGLIRHHNRVHFHGKMQCDQCDKLLSSRIAFIKHLAIHGDRKFACDECDFRCKSMEILKRHSLRHTDRKPLVCKHCPRSFIQHHELTAHMFRHTRTSSITCHYCGDCFPTKITLKSHIARVHEGKPALFCPHEGCRMGSKPFVNEISLRIHVKSHEEKDKYTCRGCDKTFHLKTALLSHELTHEWQKPRRCVYCVSGRAYIRGDLLLRHIRIKHPDNFDDNIRRIRKLLGQDPRVVKKLSKDEMNAMVNMIDALHENKVLRFEDLSLKHITGRSDDSQDEDEMAQEDFNPVMSEEELAANIKIMMELLIDKETLELLGWPESDVDTMLENLLQQCEVNVATAEKFPRVTCLRENTKQLFLRVIEDSTISRMLNTSTIDEVIRHVVSASS